MQTHHRLRSRVKGVFAFAQSECTYSVGSARHEGAGGMARQTEGEEACVGATFETPPVSLGEISENWVCVRPAVSSIWTETGPMLQHRDLVMVMAEGPSRLGSLSGYSRQGWSTSMEEGARVVSEAERGLINRDQYCFARFLPLITYDKAGGAALDGKSLMRASRSTRNKLCNLEIETKTTILYVPT